jgi:hypothetical protein
MPSSRWGDIFAHSFKKVFALRIEIPLVKAIRFVPRYGRVDVNGATQVGSGCLQRLRKRSHTVDHV